MLYDREPFTPWKIEVLDMKDEEEFEGFYRTTYQNGMECEQFTLMPKDQIEALVQLRIYKNEDIMSTCHIPSNVVIHKRKKLVTIELM